MQTKTSHDSETNAEGQQVITACAFIHHKFENETKLFLPQRALTKKFLPGKFELPGGHIDFGEDLEVGLKREIKEEFDMNISLGSLFYAFTYLNEIKGSHSVEIVYFARFLDQIDNIKLNPADHSSFLWLSESEYLNHIKTQDDKKDNEIEAIKLGFKLLRGSSLNFG